MNEPEALFWFLIGLIAVAVSALVLSFLQWRQIEREARAMRDMPLLQGAAQPTVTILVYLRNNGAKLEAALAALQGVAYQKLDIVLIDDASTDGTLSIMKRLAQQKNTLPVATIARRKLTSFTQAVQAGYAKSKKGDIAMIMTPDVIVTPDAIMRAVARKQGRAVWRSEVAMPLDATVSLSGIARTLDAAVWHQTPALLCAEKRSLHLVIPEPLIALPETRAIIGSILFVGVVWATLTAWGIEALWYVWIIVTLYGLVVVWLQYGVSIRDRLVMSYAMPSLLFLLPASHVVRGAFQLISRK